MKLLIGESGSKQALQWFESRAGDRLIGPQLLPLEVASVLRRKLSRGEIPAALCARSLDMLDQLGIEYIWEKSLLQRSFALAVELGQPTIYDTVYLALAESEQCELWTVDTRFAVAASARYPFVRCLYPI
jgi:predicted nucleic acid-binding protein